MSSVAAKKTISGAKVLKDLQAFKAANADWAILLRQTDTVIGSHTVGELTNALREEGGFPDWELFVPADERDDDPPSTFSELAKAHFGDEIPAWTPDPDKKVVFSSGPQLRNFEGRARKAFKKTRRVVETGDGPDDLDDASGEFPEEDIDLPPEFEKTSVTAPLKKEFKKVSKNHEKVRSRKAPQKKQDGPLSVKKIALSLQETFRNKPKATLKSLRGKIKYGPLSAVADLTWEIVKMAVRHKTHGLTEENCPYWSVKEIRRRCVPHITPAMIRDSVEKTFQAEKTGKIPDQRSGKIMHGALAGLGLTWGKVDLYIREKRHGLTEENCPYKGLGGFIFAECFKINANQIEKSMRETLKNNPEGKEDFDGLILHGPLADGHRNWDMVRGYMRKKQKGLTEKNCPYKDTTELLEKKIQQITPEELIDSIRQTIRETGNVPTTADGRIKHGALAYRRLSWQMANDFIRNKTNGMTTENCPEQNLLEFAKNRALTLSVETIAASVRATYKHEGRVIKDIHLNGVIMHGPLANGHRTWLMVKNFIRDKEYGLTHENCPYGTLPQLITGEVMKLTAADIAEAARLTLQQEGNLKLRGTKVKYGRLGEEGFWTWDMIRGAVEKKNYGLTAENCPYATLPELLEAYNVRQRAPQFRSPAPAQAVPAAAHS